MPKTDRHRALYVLKYLWEHTDEEHPVTLAQIQIHLFEQGIEAIPKTIDGDITALQDLGFDIIRNRSTQNLYFFASRQFSCFELKLMIDAVQSPEKAYSQLLINRVSSQYDIKAPTLYGRIQAVLDYLSGMTDVFALDLFRKIKGNGLPAV